ncbi:GNAT family N-acetyltransferase [Macrococcus bovicus]|uniref:GNAT family N-acetyltransferase n=1 Tax=Macrococcus bovicus TaxID=69968 RepID=A0A4R6BYU0_9STAP|nr:GNAT family N-acetyltransferase [Macrococcus bovicus]TDM13480.1 GNAT family N-acetyltransferase [Macrococcus bovicus]WJP97654.1 GNAT family N-acetyltransferase [Macrococcus bovicus]
MVNIRKANIEDIPAIRRVATMAWHDTYQNIVAASTIAQFLSAAYSDEHLTKRLASSVFLVAEENNEVVGFTNLINGTELFLSAIYVIPGYQRQNIGGRLIASGLEICNDYPELFVEVASDNQTAGQFYRKNGFELVREYEEDLFGEKVITGLLKKKL